MHGGEIIQININTIAILIIYTTTALASTTTLLSHNSLTIAPNNLAVAITLNSP